MAEFPSLTLVNHTSMLTGVGPGRHGVVGNVYWDRTRVARSCPTTPRPGTAPRALPRRRDHAVRGRHRGASRRAHGERQRDDRARVLGLDLRARASRSRAGESVDPGEAGSSESRDFLTAVRALLPDPLASDLVTHVRCGEDDDYAFYSAIDLLGLSTMIGLFSARGRPARLAWWSQYATDAAHHHGGPRSASRRRAARLRRATRRAARSP